MTENDPPISRIMAHLGNELESQGDAVALPPDVLRRRAERLEKALRQIVEEGGS